VGELVRPPVRDRIVVWIDSREARIVRRRGEAIELERLVSDVPPHSGATGHIRHDSMGRHGGAGDAQSAAERRRTEYLDAFLGDVEARLAPEPDIELLGPGTLRERLARRLRQSDARHRRERSVTAVPAERLTDRQLAARLRTA
jgi:hypothetical protein